MRKARFKQRVILILVIMNVLFSFGMSFAYWASGVNNTQNQNNASISLGVWYDATPIYTAQEFVDAVTTNNNANTYVLAKDIDFQNAVYPAWSNNDSIVFKGFIDGKGHTLSNISATNMRALFGVIDGATIKNLTLDNVLLDYVPSGLITSGILIGRIQGNNNLVENIRIKNSRASNASVPAGAIAGVIQPDTNVSTAVTVTIQNIKVTNTEIIGGYEETNFGTGGLVGTITTANVTMNDLYVEATVRSTALTNIGGLIGATRTNGNVTINRAVVFADLVTTTTSTVTTFGVAGMIGRNSGSATIRDSFYTGFMRSRVANANNNNNWSTQAGTISGTTASNTVNATNSRSAQITLYRNASNQAVIVNNSTSYNKMTGQKSTHSSTNYVNLRSSLTQSWWTTYYGTITSRTAIWEYNATTYLYQLKD